MLRGARTGAFLLAAAILDDPRRLGPGGQDQPRRPRRLDRDAPAAERDRVKQRILGAEAGGEPVGPRCGRKGSLTARRADGQRIAGGAGAAEAEPVVRLAADDE